jgi:hypothetical protein
MPPPADLPQDLVAGVQPQRRLAGKGRGRRAAHPVQQGIVRKRFEDPAAAVTGGDVRFDGRPFRIRERTAAESRQLFPAGVPGGVVVHGEASGRTLFYPYPHPK